jgi:hypothetical protein
VNALTEEKQLAASGGDFDDLDEHNKEALRRFWGR